MKKPLRAVYMPTLKIPINRAKIIKVKIKKLKTSEKKKIFMTLSETAMSESQLKIISAD